MIMRMSYIQEECPVCGCTINVATRYLGREVVCSHCRGEFTINRSTSEKTKVESNTVRAIEQADRILACLNNTNTSSLWQENIKTPHLISENEVIAEINKTGLLDSDLHESPSEQAVEERNLKPIALLVEPRDEVFARIAYDIARAGMRVIRAKTATEALRIFNICNPKLVVAYTKLVDQSGWLLASKLLIAKPKLKIWLYQSKSKSYDHAMAKYLQIDYLFEYGGDLLELSNSMNKFLIDYQPSCSLISQEQEAIMRAVA